MELNNSQGIDQNSGNVRGKSCQGILFITNFTFGGYTSVN